MFRPGMPVGEQAEPEGRLEPFFFLCEATNCGAGYSDGPLAGSRALAAALAASRRFLHENLSLQARKLAKF
jgi:hypothetical protein